eukprot:g24814.t1
MLMSPAAVADRLGFGWGDRSGKQSDLKRLQARVSEAPEGPIVSGPRSGAAPAPSEARLLQESVAQGRLQKTLGRGPKCRRAGCGGGRPPVPHVFGAGLELFCMSPRSLCFRWSLVLPR